MIISRRGCTVEDIGNAGMYLVVVYQAKFESTEKQLGLGRTGTETGNSDVTRNQSL